MKQYLPYIISFALLLLLLSQCHTLNLKEAQYNSNLNVLEDSVKYYRNRLGSQTAAITTLQGDKNTIQKLLLNKDAELKILTKEFTAFKSVTKTYSKFKVDTIAVRFNTPIDCDSLNFFERKGNTASKWYSLNYKVTNDSLKISSLEIPNEITTITGFKRKSLLGKQVLVTEVTNTNPYITVSNIKAAEIIVPEPWYKKWYIWLAAGIAGGFILK